MGFSRDTSAVIVVLETSEVYIVVSLSTRNDTQVIYVDPTTGVLCYTGKPGYDLFMSDDEALEHITGGSRWLCKSTTYARAILGYSALGSFGLLLVATKLTASIPNLPGGGCIYTVAETQWIKIQLQNPQPQGKGELKNIQDLTELDIDGKHYFCETKDITRPFPSHMPVQNPDEEFVWNGWLSLPFKNIGLPQHCVILLQGFTESREFLGAGQQELAIALTARRSRLHPGTRYLARGLNACYSTGNEVECEQLVWTPRVTTIVPFSTYIWRRGTIPIWWSAELKLTAAEAEIHIAEQDPYRGSLQYYQRLSWRYGAHNSDTTVGADQKKIPFVPITCINLLRNGEGKSENLLIQHFTESLNYIKSTGKLTHVRIHLINYDWHASIKYIGEQQTIESLWKLLKGPTITVGFCEGVHSDDFEGGFRLRSFQNGVIRFNCADSLDRTNAASYFGSLQVLVEQCRRLGHPLDSNEVPGYPSMSTELENCGGSTGQPGWEKHSDAVTRKTYCIDHSTTAVCEHPCPDDSWKSFDMTFDEFKRTILPSPISVLADLFLLAGDIHATLYTGSKAMHSHILQIFTDDAGKFKQFSAAQNMKITLQRRYKNALVDSSRQKQLEMFLGMRLFKHLPSVSIRPLRVLSRPSACLLKPIANMFPDANDGASILSFKRKDLTLVCPSATDVVELFIYLGEPCHVCQLLLTVSHGIEDSSFPTRVDVKTGCNLDGLKLVLEGASIPRCMSGTNLLIPLTGAISPEDMPVTDAGARFQPREKSHLSLLYGYEEVVGELNFLTRVVTLRFYPAVPGRIPVTLGEIEVLGVPLPWGDIFTCKERGLNFFELGQNYKKETPPFLSGPDNVFDCTSLPVQSLLSVPQPGGLISHDLDLLSGDLSISPSITQSETPKAENNVGEPFAFFGGSITDQQASVADSGSSFQSQDVTPGVSSGIQNYLNCCRALCGTDMARKIDFVEAMKLEVERLHLNLSAAERDRALLSIGIDPTTLDPNGLLDILYMGELRKLASSLTLLGQTAFEDNITAAIGLEAEDNGVIDFWNITRINESCATTMCEVQAERRMHPDLPPMALGEGLPLLLICSNCGRKVCKVCSAGKGAILLAAHNSRELEGSNDLSSQTGSNHGGQNDGIICKSCCKEIVHHVLLLDYVRVLSSLRRRAHADGAAQKAFDQVIGKSAGYHIAEVNRKSGFHQGIEVEQKWLGKLLDGEESLANFPFASLLHSVETAVGSAPSLSLLAPFDFGRSDSYWRAPPGISNIEFAVVLGSLSEVSGVILLVSPCGYSTSDCPVVQIWASNEVSKEERSCIGKWDIRSLTASSSEFYGPEKSSRERDVPRHLKFSFENPVRCRIIWMTLNLRRPGSSSVSLEKQCSSLSLDESTLTQPNRQRSFGDRDESGPYIHAKRLLVVGNPIRNDLGPDTSLQSSDRVNLKALLERPPQLGRFKVPIEAERLTDNDRVLEQYLSPASLGIAGFRLDAFGVIKPCTTHSPPSFDVNMWDNSLTGLEDRHIKPAVLFLRVSAIQEPNNDLVTIEEYRLPEVRAGTALYFDFSKPVQARRIDFKLLGDVAAFADDPAEQDSLDARVLSLASGLTLSNRIKLYYYADPNEIGKWASLSAI